MLSFKVERGNVLALAAGHGSWPRDEYANLIHASSLNGVYDNLILHLLIPALSSEY